MAVRNLGIWDRKSELREIDFEATIKRQGKNLLAVAASSVCPESSFYLCHAVAI